LELFNLLIPCGLATGFPLCRHSHESGNPEKEQRVWIPASAGMTAFYVLIFDTLRLAAGFFIFKKTLKK